MLPVDTMIVCAGQEPARGLYDELLVHGLNGLLIGGAADAAELDAKWVIKQAIELTVAV